MRLIVGGLESQLIKGVKDLYIISSLEIWGKENEKENTNR